MGVGYVKLSAEVVEGDAFTAYKQMQKMLGADKVEMESLPTEQNPSGTRSTRPVKHKVTGYFWAEIITPPLEQEVSDAQESS